MAFNRVALQPHVISQTKPVQCYHCDPFNRQHVPWSAHKLNHKFLSTLPLWYTCTGTPSPEISSVPASAKALARCTTPCVLNSHTCAEETTQQHIAYSAATGEHTTPRPYPKHACVANASCHCLFPASHVHTAQDWCDLACRSVGPLDGQLGLQLVQ